MDTALLTQMVEDITETKVMLKAVVGYQKEEKEERKERQLVMDERLETIEIRVTNSEKTIADAVTSWRVSKKIFSSIIAILIGVITFNWTDIASNWHILIGK